MVEKELRDCILLAIYHKNERDSKLNIETKDFCNQEKIHCINDQQRHRIFQSLKDDSYITATFFESGDALLMGVTLAIHIHSMQIGMLKG